jgi:meiotically up-regulated gene 157 (Mug157) protein
MHSIAILKKSALGLPTLLTPSVPHSHFLSNFKVFSTLKSRQCPDGFTNENTNLTVSGKKIHFFLITFSAVLKLSSSYYEFTDDLSPFDFSWQKSIKMILAVIRENQNDR